MKKLSVLFLLFILLIPNFVFGQSKIYSAPKEVIDKIKDEGMNRSQVMQTASYLSDVIGARLTGSPAMKRANEWTRETMKQWGMQNARLEPWGHFGRGWSLKNFSVHLNSPQMTPLIAYPNAWSPSTNGAVTAEVIYLNVKNDEDFARYKGKLAGKIVLISKASPLDANFEPLATRRTDEKLLELANTPNPLDTPRGQAPPEFLQRLYQSQAQYIKITNFLLEEKAAVIVENSFDGSGGTLFVEAALVAQPVPPDLRGIFGERFVRPWEKESESKILPHITMATEDYNRLMRLINLGITPQMTVNIQSQYHNEDLTADNTIAEISGTDPKLKEEIVMLGGHLDSWHSGTGATDNAAGCAVVMEAARILLATGLKPRRTIRVALWSGEEQRLFGSQNYVKKHFGYLDEDADAYILNLIGITNTPPGKLIKQADYDKLSAYYNLDNGTGKIRGVYLQGNSVVAPIFKEWLIPFAEMGAKTVTLANTGNTDHVSFDRIGLPGFQFIQDRIEYDTRTHHSNQDNFDRLQADDLKQASIIMAAFIYQTAMMDEKLPRKPVSQ